MGEDSGEVIEYCEPASVDVYDLSVSKRTLLRAESRSVSFHDNTFFTGSEHWGFVDHRRYKLKSWPSVVGQAW